MSKKKSDITAKITCILIAIFLWSFVMSEVDPIRTKQYNVKVALNNISALDRQSLVVMEPQEVTVNIEVSGKKSDLHRFLSSNINAFVDLSGYSEGQVKIPVMTSLIGQTSGVSITDVRPREILFTLDRLVTKEMPLIINTTGELPENYVLGDLTSKSKSVLISGPRTWVNEVNKVIASVDLSERTSTTTEAFGTVIIDDEGKEVRGVSKEPNSVDITIPVLRTVSLPIELITANELPPNFSITNINITPSAIKVKGNSNIANLQKINTVEVDINSLLGKSALEVELNFPEGVELLNPDEKVIIKYDIEETTSKAFTLSVRDLNIRDLDNKLTLTEDDLGQLVKINLRGYKSVLDDLSNEDLNVTLDLSNAVEGNNSVEVIVEEIKGVKVESINPQKLSLKIISF
ncbi:hypothetical protein E9840_07190 [Tissierella creatinini]|nr:hypothetical protein E9840_07190 [Tissierella creatinini]TJX66047.1 hypothetical protein E8P77_09145 [Soehngenia saccharolytica]